MSSHVFYFFVIMISVVQVHGNMVDQHVWAGWIGLEKHHS